MANKKNFRFVGGPLDGQFKELDTNLDEWFYQAPQDKPAASNSASDSETLFLSVLPESRYVKDVFNGEDIFRFSGTVE
jgi:hypothetical protein